MATQPTYPAFDIDTMSDLDLADRAARYDLAGDDADPREVVFFDAAIARGLEAAVLESYDYMVREREYAAAGY